MFKVTTHKLDGGFRKKHLSSSIQFQTLKLFKSNSKTSKEAWRYCAALSRWRHKGSWRIIIICVHTSESGELTPSRRQRAQGVIFHRSAGRLRRDKTNPVRTSFCLSSSTCCMFLLSLVSLCVGILLSWCCLCKKKKSQARKEKVEKKTPYSVLLFQGQQIFSPCYLLKPSVWVCVWSI